MAALDYLLNAVHLVTVAAVLFLWIPKRTRRLHLILVAITAVSWLGLGAFYGWGYCFLTDWHWRIKDALGQPHPNSFIKYAVDTVTGQDFSAALVDTVTAITFAVVTIISIALNPVGRGLARWR